MAENIREQGADGSEVDQLRASLKKECADQSKNTLYTSTSFYIWLRVLRFRRTAIWILAVIASTIAASSAVTDLQIPALLVAGLTLAGVLLPGVVKALKLDDTIEKFAKQAALFKYSESALRRASDVWSNKSIEDFEKEARAAFESLDEARLESLTPPEWCFKAAQKKIQSGDYTPD